MTNTFTLRIYFTLCFPQQSDCNSNMLNGERAFMLST